MLIATAIGIAVNRDLLSVVMLSSIYGLLSANFFVTMDAVDVAFTEAAVGAGISPLLMFTTMAIVGRYEKLPHRWSLSALVLVSITGALLLVATMDMPAFGAPDAPAQQHVAPRYIEQSGQEVGIPNIVTSVLATYRGFDTFGEVTVIFTAGVGVLSLLMVGDRATKPLSSHLLKASQHKILRIVSKVLIAPILLFALYVQFHGDYGPGGGFQAGVILAVAVILYALVFGVPSAMRAVPPAFTRSVAAVGVLLYAGVGFWAMLQGGQYLEYQALFQEEPGGHHGQHVGIILIELGVLFGVSGAMLTIFYAFAGRVAEIRDEDW